MLWVLIRSTSLRTTTCFCGEITISVLFGWKKVPYLELCFYGQRYLHMESLWGKKKQHKINKKKKENGIRGNRSRIVQYSNIKIWTQTNYSCCFSDISFEYCTPQPLYKIKTGTMWCHQTLLKIPIWPKTLFIRGSFLRKKSPFYMKLTTQKMMIVS